MIIWKKKRILLQSLFIFQFLMNGMVVSANIPDSLLCRYIASADAYFEQLRYDSAEYLYFTLIPLMNQQTDKDEYCRVINNYAASLYWQDKLVEAKPVFYENLKTCTRLLGPRHAETAQAHINLGAFQCLASSYENIASHFLQAVYILEDVYGKNHPKVARAYEWLGSYHEGNADTLISRKYLWKSFSIWKKTKGTDHPDLAEIYRYMGLYFKRYNFNDSAMYCFSKAKSLFDRRYGQANLLSVKCLNNLADVYARIPSMESKILPTYQLCEDLTARQKSPLRMASVMTLYNMAEYFNIKGDKQLALKYLNEILTLYYPDFKNGDFFQNPQNVVSFPYILPELVFHFKSGIFLELAKSDSLHKIKYLKAAHECHSLAFQIIEEKRKSPNSIDDMLNFINSYARIYYYFAQTELKIYTETGDKNYLDQAIMYLLKMNLPDKITLTEDYIREVYNIPEKVIAQRDKLLKELNELKAAKLSAGNNPLADRMIVEKTIETDAFYTENIKSYLVSKNEIAHKPEFKVSEFQKKLSKDECLLLYSELRKDYNPIPELLVIIAINKNQIATLEIKGQEVFEQIVEYYKLLTTQTPYDSLFAQGVELYRHLIMPVENVLTKNIIIVPSAHLSKLPFDILPDIKNSNNGDTLMLIQNYLIRKEFSLNDLINQHPSTDAAMNDSILAVAPVFNKNQINEISLLTKRDTSLINLPGAAAECNMISSYFETNQLCGLKASKNIFLNICNRYAALHISTHGTPGNGDNTTMQLAFSSNDSNTSNDRWLNFYEILNLKLNTELIVLSACKTGIGKLNDGEGSLNLAWAFRQAGVKSSIISLWDVNDYASSKIMSSFYQNLKNGLTKPEALRQAKLDYLKNTDEVMSNPYYWAGFEYYGDDSGFSSSNNGSIPKRVILLLAGLIITFTLILFTKKLNQLNNKPLQNTKSKNPQTSCFYL